MIGSKFELTPLTIIWEKYLFWSVNNPKISSILIPKEAFNNSIKNYKED